MVKKDNDLDLIRTLLGGLNITDVKFPEHLLQSEDPLKSTYKEFLRYCNQVATTRLDTETGETFLEFCEKNLVAVTAQKALLDSKSYEELQFNRAAINGMALLTAFFRKYSNEYVDKYLNKDKAEFDKFRSF